MASLNKFFCLTHRIVDQPASLPTSRKGDQTKSAHELTAILNFQIRSSRGIIPDSFKQKILRVHALMMNTWHRPFPLLQGRWQDIGQLHFKMIPNNQINALDLTKHIKTRLCITARHGHKSLR